MKMGLHTGNHSDASTPYIVMTIINKSLSVYSLSQPNAVCLELKSVYQSLKSRKRFVRKLVVTVFLGCEIFYSFNTGSHSSF